MFISRCSYCNVILMKDHRTKEHLVPVCYGGTGYIYTCQHCNEARGNSLSYPKFITFIRRDPELYLLHVAQSSNSELVKLVLNTLPECETEEEIDEVESFIKKNTGKASSPSNTCVRELVKQYVALERSRQGMPIPNGRSSKARRRALRTKKKKRERRELKLQCEDAVRFMNNSNK